MLPVSPMVVPSNLREQPNGRVDPSLLVPVHARGSLHRSAFRGWQALVAWSAQQGLPLTFTFGGMYRSYAQQETLFRQRYTTSPIAGQSRKWWNGQWWYLRKGMAMAAVPGTSNHGLGLAIDAAFDRNPTNGLNPEDAGGISTHPKFALWRDNVARFGFSFEVQSEPWHIRYVVGDTVPAAVAQFEAGVAPVLPPFNPAGGQWSLWPLAAKAAAKTGDTGDRVRYLQGVLKLKAGQPVPVDGVFGASTEAAVENIQRFFGLAVDGWVGAQTWTMIDFLAGQ